MPRVQAWIDRRDLSRRRAIELVRYHVRRSQPAAPSLLSRAELRELAPHADAIAALDTEWRRADHSPAAERAWTPGALVARSRQVQRRVTLAAIGLVLTVIAGIGAAIFERWRSANDRKAEIVRRDRDLGLIAFEFAPFDWNVDKLEPIDVPITDLPNLRWAIHTVKLDPDTDVEDPGDPYPAERFRLLSSELLSGGTRLDTAEASGGPAFLVISGRNRAGEPDCGPSIIPIRALPGYPQRVDRTPQHRIAVPTCQTTLADMILVSGGHFVFGGIGTPPSALRSKDPALSAPSTEHEPPYWISRHEFPNGLLRPLLASATMTGLHSPKYPHSPELIHSQDRDVPLTNVDQFRARSLCRYFGQDLPSNRQWTRALRGPTTTRPPDRNTPLGTSATFARLYSASSSPRIGTIWTTPLDISPSGARNLAGNAQEWTRDRDTEGMGITRGGNWAETTYETAVDFIANENARDPRLQNFAIGFRCAFSVR